MKPNYYKRIEDIIADYRKLEDRLVPGDARSLHNLTDRLAIMLRRIARRCSPTVVNIDQRPAIVRLKEDLLNGHLVCSLDAAHYNVSAFNSLICDAREQLAEEGWIVRGEWDSNAGRKKYYAVKEGGAR